MLLPSLDAAAAVLLLIVAGSVIKAEGKPHRIVVDTDVATDDLLALLYLLMLNTSQFQFEAVTINANTWSSAGHAVNHIYDLLYMMGRDDIAVGVGGEGGILPNGTILPNVGGYLPIIDQGMTTTGGCRYRQAIPVGLGGRLDVDANYGIWKAFLPQGKRKYTPLEQPTAQQVLIEKVSAGPTTLFMIGAHTNVAIFLMNNPHLKKNVEHIYIMGGGVRSSNPTGCCPKNASSSCVPQQCGDRGNIFTDYNTNPYAEFNIFGDPFAAYQDGYTKEVHSPDSVRVLVATKAKPNRDVGSSLDREYFINFLKVLKQQQQAGRYNFTTQFPYYKKVTYKPDFHNIRLGKPVVFDMDMSAGDFLALFYLLKVPVQVIDLKAIIVSPTGWANAATIDIIYDILHMMGRDDIPVGLGDVFAVNQTDPILPVLGDCKYVKAIPHGSGGYLDSNTLYGLACYLPRSPRRYTGEKTVKFGAPRDTDYPELRQPLAMEVWESVLQTMKPGTNITVLSNGPLTNLAKVVSVKNISSRIQEVYVVGGHISRNTEDKGNVFLVPSNQYAEFNMFLDPLAAKTVFESEVNIILIPLSTQHRVSSFATVIGRLNGTRKTPEVVFSKRLLSSLHRLKQIHNRYHHMDTFLGEILGAVVLADKGSSLKPKFEKKPIKVLASGDESTDGKMVVDEKHGKLVRILSNVDENAYYNLYANKLGDQYLSAKVGSFKEQTRKWRHPHDDKPSQEKCAEFHGYKAFYQLC
ncbi:inosine-uridine preferring nucleoside hydrolase family protein [Trifolium repens]|nr:inosine-uridine preferring nucleoside hydrolase family protein [Trifolium repens]